jgi:hypothetical protein
MAIWRVRATKSNAQKAMNRYASRWSDPTVSSSSLVPAPALLTTRKVTITHDLENADGRSARVLIQRPTGLLLRRTTTAFEECAREVTLKPRIAARRVIGPRS